MGFNGFFGFFSKALLLSMNWLANTLSLPYGWAIIVITVIIKGLFWPITAAQTRMSRRMAALQPQMKAIQEKYKDDPLKAQKKIGEFWKEHKINPLSGCLPLLLQMPVFFGFFFMIRTAIELRGAKFLWVADLSKPDTLFVIPGLNFIPFLATPEGLPFNLLPLLMGVTMLWQAHLMPPSPGMDPTQQKIMKYMPVMFILFLYNYSAGLALYWTVQNLLSVLQTKFTKVEPPKTPPAPTTSPALTPASKKKK
jgi:YidC/Oxa1 family membrane protein insertase